MSEEVFEEKILRKKKMTMIKKRKERVLEILIKMLKSAHCKNKDKIIMVCKLGGSFVVFYLMLI